MAVLMIVKEGSFSVDNLKIAKIVLRKGNILFEMTETDIEFSE